MGRQRTASFHAVPLSRNRADENDPAPLLLFHSIDDILAKHKGRSKVDVVHLVKLLHGYVPDVPDPLPVTCIRHENVNRSSAMFGANMVAECLGIV